MQGEDIAQSDPNTKHVHAALASLDLLVVQDLFLNETAKFAHVLLPGTSFLEKDGTFTNAERRINRVRPVMAAARPASTSGRSSARSPRRWATTCTTTTPAQIMDEIAPTTPTFAGVSFDLLDKVGSVQWPCNAEHPTGTDDHARRRRSRAGKGQFVADAVRPDHRAQHPQATR